MAKQSVESYFKIRFLPSGQTLQAPQVDLVHLEDPEK